MEEDIKNCVDISDEDIKEAFRDIKNYVDITLEDFKEIYRLALKHATEKIQRESCGKDKN